MADSVHWEVAPENAVAFNSDLRLDHTRIARMNVKGTTTLTPISPVKCEEDRVVEGASIQIEVT